MKAASPEAKRLFSAPFGRAALRRLSLQWMGKLFPKASRAVEVVVPASEAGVATELRVTVSRESFRKELMRLHALDAFFQLVEKLIDVLRAYNIQADGLMSTSPLVQLEELRLFIASALTGHSKDKRFVERSAPGFLAQGALWLQELILQQRLAIDPAFYGSLFWPSAALRAANDAAWKISGVTKILHTKTDVPPVASLPPEALDALRAQADAFVAAQLDHEARAAQVEQQRAELRQHIARIQQNLLALKQAAVQARKAAAQASKAVAKPPADAAGEAAAQAGETGEATQAGEAGEATQASEAAQTAPPAESAGEAATQAGEPAAEAAAEAAPTAVPAAGGEEAQDANLEHVKALEKRLREIQKRSEDEAFLFGPPENVQSLLQQLESCNQETLGIGAAFPSVTLDSQPVLTPGKKANWGKGSWLVAPMEVEKSSRKKRRGCCKGKSDVAPRGPDV